VGGAVELEMEGVAMERKEAAQSVAVVVGEMGVEERNEGKGGRESVGTREFV
jgi:hypothetical protein